MYIPPPSCLNQNSDISTKIIEKNQEIRSEMYKKAEFGYWKSQGRGLEETNKNWSENEATVVW